MKRKVQLIAALALAAGTVMGHSPVAAEGAAAEAGARRPSPADEPEPRRSDWLRTLHPTPACPLPPALENEQLIAFGAYDGDSIASAWVGGPDNETALIDVIIEPGRQSLYLILTSYESMIWRLSGATSRVRKVVISSYHNAERDPSRQTSRPVRRLAYRARTSAEAWRRVAASGVVGVPARKVVIAPAHCPKYFYQRETASAAFAIASEALGREPDAVFAAYSAQRVRLPSGRVTEAERDSATMPGGFDREMWIEATRFWPGGLVYVPPGAVVAATPVGLYEVLPSQMGLAQLIGAGAVEPLGGESFRVLRPIPRLPPRMSGAHSVTLILADGVPPPPGDSGHSCMIRERDEHLLRAGGECPGVD
ncbi:MAG TPA: hypothetical protein VEA60_00345 [Allosphingosinicella sp.]|nr:hypothetical protein [Allosphingosinicella sp.]